MSKTFSAEFGDTPAGRAALLRTAAELLEARRQFAVTPQFDGTGEGLSVRPGFLLSWPASPDPVAPDAPTVA